MPEENKTPETPETPETEQKSLTSDDLLAMIKEQGERSAAALETLAASRSEPSLSEPASEPPKSLSADEIAEQFKEYVNSGEADKAYKLATEMALQPQMAGMMTPIHEQLGEMNLDRLQKEAGDLYTPARAKLFEQKRQEYGLKKSAFKDYKVVQDLWKITIGSDPSVEAERQAAAEKRIAEIQARHEEELAKYRKGPAALSPVTPPLPEDFNKDEVGKYLFDDNPEVRQYLDKQLSAPHYGVSHATYIKQRMKDDDPRCVEKVGVGPFSKNTWTLIGDPPDPNKKLI